MDDVSLHVEAYTSAANTLERLTRLESNRKNATKVETLQILISIFRKFHLKPKMGIVAILYLGP